MLRARHLFLMPGDSPVGLRLPLQSLPWEPADDCASRCGHPIRWRPRADLPVPQRQYEAMAVRRQSSLDSAARERRSDPVRREAAIHPGVVRTALTVEAARRPAVRVPAAGRRRPRIIVDLAAAVEDTAAKLEMPVLIEGYPPPHDSRIADTSRSRPTPASSK